MSDKFKEDVEKTVDEIEKDEVEVIDEIVCEQCEKLKEELNEKSIKCEDYFSKLQRLAADFDNFKKRTLKEKDAIYQGAISDIITTFLVVIDNFDRAIKIVNNEENVVAIREGVDMMYRQLKDTFKKLEVEEIDCVGQKFDPNLHNALMHVEDENFSENEVVEEFQKGYIYRDKVIRHSGVKVAN